LLSRGAFGPWVDHRGYRAHLCPLPFGPFGFRPGSDHQRPLCGDAKGSGIPPSRGGDKRRALGVLLFFGSALRGQGFEIPVPIGSFPLGDGDLPSVVEEFHRRHGERYGFSNRNAEIELVNLRLRAVGRTEKPELPEVSFTGTLEDAVWERRWVHFAEEGEVRAPVFSREKLPAGAEFPGPAVVEGPESTVLIPPGCRAFVDRFGNLILEV